MTRARSPVSVFAAGASKRSSKKRGHCAPRQTVYDEGVYFITILNRIAMADTNQSPQNQNSGAKPQGNTGLSWSQPQNDSQQKSSSQKPMAPVPPEDSLGGRIIAIIVAVIIIFAVGAWGIVALRNRGNTTADTDTSGSMASSTDMDMTGGTQTAAEMAPTPSSTSASEAMPAVSSVNNASSVFSVASQPAGVSVAVTNMHLSQPTWIIVYESRNGKPGNVLGAGLFYNTDTSGTVPLLRGTTAGQTYFVTAALDTGSRVFSMQAEKPVVDQNGAQVWTTFTAQ